MINEMFLIGPIYHETGVLIRSNFEDGFFNQLHLQK